MTVGHVDSEPERLRLVNVTKRFSGVVALKEVSLNVRRLETLGLVGENGAGKSTLLDIVCGVRQPDSGEIVLDGVPARLQRPSEALSHGIFRVHQEQVLINNYKVYQNLYLGAEQYFSRNGLLLFNKMQINCARIFDELGIDVAPDQITSELNFGSRQLIEIGRVVALCEVTNISHPIVLLDEPTAALSGRELTRFFDIVRSLKKRYRASIIFVSHRLGEVTDLSDRLLILKDGMVVGDAPPDIAPTKLHWLMVGRERSSDFYNVDKQRTSFGEPVLSLHGLTSRVFRDISLDVRAGEIVGIGGLVQSGKTELGRAIIGAVPSDGQIFVGGQAIGRLATSRRVERSIAYVPLNRHREGVSLGLSVERNIVLPNMKSFSRFGLMRAREIRKLVAEQIRRYRIVTLNADALLRNLSGGNQQKVVIAKWMVKRPRLLILDNPTRGVDAGAKEEIYEIIRQVADAGSALLLISDDLVELIKLSNRILVMRDGQLSGELPAPAHQKPSEQDVVRMMV